MEFGEGGAFASLCVEDLGIASQATIETIGGELFDLSEEVFGFCGVEAVFLGTFDKAAALLFHFEGVFFTHSAAQDVGFTEGIAGEYVGDLHDLFLVDADAVGATEDRLEDIEDIVDLFLSVFSEDERVGHTALEGSGSVEGDEGDDVFKTGGSESGDQLAHSGGFELEDAQGIGVAQKVEYSGVFDVDGFHIDGDASVLFDQVEAIFDQGKVLESEEVELDQADAFDPFHIELRDDFAFCAFVEGEVFDERASIGDDDASGVDGGVSVETFESAGDIEKFGKAGIFFDFFAQTGFLLEGVVKGDIEDVGDEFGEAVGFVERDVHSAANVF